MTGTNESSTTDPSCFHIEGEFNTEGRLLYYGNEANIKGWVIPGHGGGRLAAYYDGRLLTVLRPHGERADVVAAHPEAPLLCGFVHGVEISTIPTSARDNAILTLQFELEGHVLKTASFPLAEGNPHCRLHIDTIIGPGERLMVTTPNSQINGWCIAQEQIVSIDAEVGHIIVPVQFGIPRADVSALHRRNPNGLNTGFSLFLRQLPEGDSNLTFHIAMRGGSSATKEFLIHATKAQELPRPTGRRQYSEVRFWQLAADRRATLHWVAIISDPDRTRPIKALRSEVAATVRSLRETGHGTTVLLPNWYKKYVANEIGIAFYESLSDLGQKLRRMLDDTTFASFFSVGDISEPTTLNQLVTSFTDNTDLIYWDEYAQTKDCRTLVRKTPGAPFVTEMHLNAIGRGWAARLTPELVDEITAGSIPEAVAAHPLLQFYRVPEKCLHIPECLSTHTYGRPLGSLNDTEIAARANILNLPGQRYGAFAKSVEPSVSSDANSDRLHLIVMLTSRPLVSIIIPTIGIRGRVIKCLHDIRDRTAYRNVEIIVLDHTAKNVANLAITREIRKLADSVLPVTGPFNWSRFNNMGAAIAQGDVLLFLNDDVEVVTENWLDELLCYLNFDRVGAVGPRLLLPESRHVQSAGISLLTTAGWARNDFAFSERDHPLAEGINLHPRNCSSLLGAAIAVPRDLFERVGGFDERLPLTFNDLDFHLRLRHLGYQVICNPLAELVHHEKNSRAEIRESPMEDVYWRQWQDVHGTGDPYWHPAVERDSGFYNIDPEPVEAVWYAETVAMREDVRRILLLRLDHVGDFVLTLSAFQQMRDTFPKAVIEIAVGAWNADLARQTQLFDVVHEITLYMERSGGGRAVSDAECQASMNKRFGDEIFDLAVDFRLDGDTRFLLAGINATHRAGFSHGSKHPWLDISIEWEGNIPQWHKTVNIAVQLRRLVAAVEVAFPAQRQDFSVWRKSQTSHTLPKAEKPGAVVIAMHPFPGNEIKMWPEQYWIALTRLVIQAGGAAVLIGATNDRETAAGLVRSLVHAGATDRVGEFTISELVPYLAQTDCFVGVDSGPKHLAASTNIPTICIQSGFVDPVSWAPNCAQGVSIVKRVSCAPCYLDRIHQCTRNHLCMQKISPSDVFRYISAVTGLQHTILAGGRNDIIKTPTISASVKNQDSLSRMSHDPRRRPQMAIGRQAGVAEGDRNR